MTQEDIRLLITDLSARTPYGVFVQKTEDGEYGRLISVQIPSYCVVHIEKNYWSFDEYDLSKQTIKPYLRPLSSMTEIEKEEYDKFFTTITAKEANFGKWISPADDVALIDWYNKHHFDYRGLIPMGLALEAPEGMYA